jgi:hypothetical protein
MRGNAQNVRRDFATDGARMNTDEEMWSNRAGSFNPRPFAFICG